MSKARPVYPGSVLFSTRRTHKRQFLLRPDAEINAAIIYLAAVLTERYGIRLHALCAMSNHTHDVGTDALGNVVDFERDLRALVTRVVNDMHGDVESLWSRGQSRRVHCHEAETIIDKIVYTMINPVVANLVAHGKNWPGIRLAWPTRPRTARRPAFFRTHAVGGKWPEEATLVLHRPPGHEHLSDDELAALIRARIEQREQAARDAARVACRRFLGRRRVLAQSRYSYPSRPDERLVERTAGACRSRAFRRPADESGWLACYETALARYRAGETDVVFPYGTWKMRVYYSAACDPLPDGNYPAYCRAGPRPPEAPGTDQMM